MTAMLDAQMPPAAVQASSARRHLTQPCPPQSPVPSDVVKVRQQLFNVSGCASSSFGNGMVSHQQSPSRASSIMHHCSLRDHRPCMPCFCRPIAQVPVACALCPGHQVGTARHLIQNEGYKVFLRGVTPAAVGGMCFGGAMPDGTPCCHDVPLFTAMNAPPALGLMIVDDDPDASSRPTRCCHQASG